MRYLLNLVLIILLFSNFGYAQDETAVKNVLLESPLMGQTLTLDTYFQWIVVNGVSHYQLEIYEEENSESPVLNITSQSNEIYLPVLSREKLTAGQKYHWRVIGVDADGKVIAESEFRVFTVEQP